MRSSGREAGQLVALDRASAKSSALRAAIDRAWAEFES